MRQAKESFSRSKAESLLPSFSPAYDDEPEYDPAEPEEPEDSYENAPVDDLAIGQNPDQLLMTGDRGVIESGDPSAVANRTGKDKAPKDKKIPNDKRQTTPYMTKYERARILGTRALQIRYVYGCSVDGFYSDGLAVF